MAKHRKRRRRVTRTAVAAALVLLSLLCALLVFCLAMLLSAQLFSREPHTDDPPQTEPTTAAAVTYAATAATAQATTTAVRRTTTTTTRRTTSMRTTVAVTLSGQKVLTDVPTIAQNPAFPTGCESVSAVIAMQYAGINITVDEFVDNYLEKSSSFYTENGTYYGPDPYKVFVGSPRSSASYGCMAPVIKNAMRACLDESITVRDRTGYSLPMLCRQYIDKGIPCIVWVSIGMLPTYKSASWTLSDGTVFSWPANEHCMVLIGYSDTHYYFSDPYRGKQVQYSRSISEQRFEELGRQALVVTG